LEFKAEATSEIWGGIN